MSSTENAPSTAPAKEPLAGFISETMQQSFEVGFDAGKYRAARIVAEWAVANGRLVDVRDLVQLIQRQTSPLSGSKA